ncbi:shikimate dehydrogenase [Pseudomonas asplenii]|uniref:shikimate dehydrogenase n=1 Tax=Pseudomonas asplenii TaxID=53407 RepID=UPI0037C5A6D4
MTTSSSVQHPVAPNVLIGLIGAGLQSSMSPALHMREGSEQNLVYLYKLIDLDLLGLDANALPALMNSARQMGYNGLNITFPCKQSVLPLLDELSDEARSIGAVNTVVIKDGRTIGYNTDCLGFAEGFKRGLSDARRERVVQMGAGGAGSAVAYALLQQGVQQLSIFDIEAERGMALVNNLNARFGNGRAVLGDDLEGALSRADGLVNTTPMGMAKLPGMPVPVELLRADLWVADVVYFPIETQLLRSARALGCRTLGGGTMNVFQAVKCFELFTGIRPDTARMERHFLEEVGQL